MGYGAAIGLILSFFTLPFGSSYSSLFWLQAFN